MVRCKFTITSIAPPFVPGEPETNHTVTMGTVYCPDVPEDQAFTKYTPWGNLEFGTNNPRALEQLVVGRVYYLDLTEVPASSEAAA